MVDSCRQEDRADCDEECQEVEGALAAFDPGLAAGRTPPSARRDLFLREPPHARQYQDEKRGQGGERKDTTGMDVRLSLADGAAPDDATHGMRPPRKGLQVRCVHGRILRSFRNRRVDNDVGGSDGVVGKKEEKGREAKGRFPL
eukprot:evm.model.NODE_35244_length_30808_cov_23.771132.7